MSKDFEQKVVEIDESVREIGALDELYTGAIHSRPETGKELESKKEEAKFARDRILKLSLHVKNLLKNLEAHETLK
jgi:hypothetical protein